MDPVLDLGERVRRAAVDAADGGARCESARGAPLSLSLPAAASAPTRCRGRLAVDPAAGVVRPFAVARSASAANARAAPDFGSASTIVWPSVIARGIDRSLGTSTSGRSSEQLYDVSIDDADARVGAVQDERDACRVVAHLLERLEPDLRVLERERVEHADEAEVRRERRSRRSPRARTQAACRRSRSRSWTAGPRRPSRRNGIVTAAAWSGRTGASSACAPEECWTRKPVDLLGVERCPRRPRGRRSSGPGCKPRASPTSPNWRSRSTITG